MLLNFNIKKLVYTIKSKLSSSKILKSSINDLKDQTEDHLCSINENTNEIHANYEHALEIESKIDKLAERMDEISMLFGAAEVVKNPTIPKLSRVEKAVFLALYALSEEMQYVTYRQISESVNLSETLVMNYITILIEKGVPIIKSYGGNRTRLRVSSYFKNRQTKSDILKLNHDASKQVVLNSYLVNN